MMVSQRCINHTIGLHMYYHYDSSMGEPLSKGGWAAAIAMHVMSAQLKLMILGYPRHSSRPDCR